VPLVILHHLLNVSVQLANKRGLKKKNDCGRSGHFDKWTAGRQLAFYLQNSLTGSDNTENSF
jgi:hypothetical protein